ncbi:hypothetical protein BJ508DRAFT_334332 [Ascobolus immersus RN42]|uniref:Uncharacterized protein n=1 Tax=Ascobolus immersus RN42 TaxID=1160509 RepID=A0A3N4HJR3_ASCIM|nr:hypothetical protein BJ508DRAFT_334332 [Ascobolus immersus RN42]
MGSGNSKPKPMDPIIVDAIPPHLEPDEETIFKQHHSGTIISVTHQARGGGTELFLGLKNCQPEYQFYDIDGLIGTETDAICIIWLNVRKRTKEALYVNFPVGMYRLNRKEIRYQLQEREAMYGKNSKEAVLIKLGKGEAPLNVGEVPKKGTVYFST